MIPVHLPHPTRAEDVFAWSRQWLAANQHLPRAEQYPALTGALVVVAESALRRAARAEAALLDAQIEAAIR